MRRLLLMVVTALPLLAGCAEPLDIDRLINLNRIILRPEAELTITPADVGFAYESITIPVTDTRAVMAWYVPCDDPRGLIVVIPGSADNRSLYARLALPLIGDAGYDILLMDYEGFGDSPGEASLAAAADDAMAVTAYAMTRHENVILFGISLGTPLAARAAAEYDVTALIMDANLIVQDTLDFYASRQSFVQSQLLLAIAGPILQAQLPEAYDTLEYVSRANGAKLIIHSPDDMLTPFASALDIYQAAAPPKTFWQEYDDHGRMIRVEPNVYADTLLSWLNAVIANR